MATAKRKADGELPHAGPKRPQLDTGQLSLLNDHEPPSVSSTPRPAPSIASHTSHSTPVETPQTTLPPASQQSRAPPRKYPSDLKTIPCTFPGCPKTFNRASRLAAHLRSHTGDRPFKCAQCPSDYMEEKHLRAHIKSAHTAERSYTCLEPNCGRAFLTATRLRRHAAVHAGQEKYRCRGYAGCTRHFRKKATLARHVRVEHLGLKGYPCGNDGCSAGFDSPNALKSHVDREHGTVRFWCEECGREDGEPHKVGFSTLAQLEMHVRHAHIDCMFCAARCASQSELESHLEAHHSSTTSLEERKTVACGWEGCGKKFTRVSNLNTHVRTAHEGLRYVCGEVSFGETEDLQGWDPGEGCRAGFLSKMKLEEHVRFVHLLQERPKAAKSAKGADFVDLLSGARQEAMRTVACLYPGCGQMFSRHHDLNIHVVQQHQEPEEELQLSSRGHDFDMLALPGLADLFSLQPLMQEGPETFWIGGGEYPEPAGQPGFAAPQDDWEVDEAEMRRLIGNDAEDTLAAALDPSLLEF